MGGHLNTSPQVGVISGSFGTVHCFLFSKNTRRVPLCDLSIFLNDGFPSLVKEAC